VHSIIRVIARTLFRMGGLGLLTLGIFDSSPLVLPLGNDLLMLALSARHHDRVPYYIAMATLGSLIGCLSTDWISRKSERGLKKILPGKYQESIVKMVKTRAGWTLVFSSLMPPPFPFTAIVAAAAAFRYPRQKLLGFLAVGRLIRFSIEAALAIHYGRWIIRQARSPLLEHVMIVIIVISIAGSAYSIYQRTDGEKRRPRHRVPEPDSARP
jgi:membrane protein YqaA with SNARE-associated domain